MSKKHDYPFHSTKEEIEKTNGKRKSIYQLAFTDSEFLLREELRPVRLQLELLKTELVLQDHKVEQTIVFFGSARIPAPEQAKAALEKSEAALAKDPHNSELKTQVNIATKVYNNSLYQIEATKLAKIVSEYQGTNLYVVTGGGPSFMEAANKGAYEAKKPSVALGVMLPHEQVPNEYVTPELTFEFHYFAIRKMHFLMRAQALAAFPGGFGTLDELFETLTLIQTQKIDPIPLMLFNKSFWTSIIDFEAIVEQGTISASDLDLFHFVETADEAWEIIKKFHNYS